MANIRWRPLCEMENLLKEIEHTHPHHHGLGELATDVSEDKNNVYVDIHAPGIAPDKVDISVHQNQLRVSGSREEKTEFADRDYYHKEIKCGSFERTIALPCEVDEKKAKANFDNGVISITLPKKANQTEHKIEISKK